MDWQQTTLNPAGRPAFIQLVRTPADKRDGEIVARSVAATESLMAMLEAHLERRAFMAGEAFTMADIPIACEVDRWQALPLERPRRPRLERWFAAILAQPAASGVLQLPAS